VLQPTHFCSVVDIPCSLSWIWRCSNQFLTKSVDAKFLCCGNWCVKSPYYVNNFCTFVPLQALLCKWTLVMFLQNKFLLLFGVTSLVNRPVTSLGHHGVRRVFWEWPNLFIPCPIVIKMSNTFFLGGRIIFTGVLSSSQHKNWEGEMFDFRRKTLFCVGYHLSKHKMTINSKNLSDHGPFGPPWLRLWCSPPVTGLLVKLFHYVPLFVSQLFFNFVLFLQCLTFQSVSFVKSCQCSK